MPLGSRRLSSTSTPVSGPNDLYISNSLLPCHEIVVVVELNKTSVLCPGDHY